MLSKSPPKFSWYKRHSHSKDEEVLAQKSWINSSKLAHSGRKDVTGLRFEHNIMFISQITSSHWAGAQNTRGLVFLSVKNANVVTLALPANMSKSQFLHLPNVQMGVD